MWLHLYRAGVAAWRGSGCVKLADAAATLENVITCARFKLKKPATFAIRISQPTALNDTKVDICWHVRFFFRILLEIFEVRYVCVVSGVVAWSRRGILLDATRCCSHKSCDQNSSRKSVFMPQIQLKKNEACDKVSRKILVAHYMVARISNGKS